MLIRNNLGRAVTSSLVVMMIFATTLGAASAGAVRGKVLGPDGTPLAGVLVELRNDVTGFKQETPTTADGGFSFFNIPYNPYTVHVDVQGFAPSVQTVDVHSAVPVEITVKVAAAQISETINVSASASVASLETDNTQSHVDIDKSYIAKAPAAVASRAMEQIITSTPGFAKDENGRFHFQGAHSQSEYVIDGQTISDQTGVTFSNSIDPGIAQGIEIIYGNIPAEFGEKVGAVINLTTKSGLGTGAAKGDAYAGVSKFSTVEGGASLGGGSQTFGYFGSINASKSKRFLDAVNFDNLHNDGDTMRGFMRLDIQAPDSRNAFRFTTLLGSTRRDVPNTYTQEAAGQDQRVRSNDENFNAGWQSIFSQSAVLELNGFGRFSKFRLHASPNDTPVTATSDRTLNNYGFSPSLSWTSANHEVKAGINWKRYPLREHFAFALTDPGANDPESPDYNPNLAAYDLTRGGTPFVFDGRQTGTYYAAYVQDNIKVRNLTANLGVRYDKNNLPRNESAFEPRIGLGYYVSSTKTVLRASYNRVLYTPEFENILFSSSTAAAALVPPEVQASRELGSGELLVHSERQNAYDFGVQQAVGPRLRLDFDYWKRKSRFPGDQDQFENTGIVFPLSFSTGDLNGWNVRADLASTGGLHGFASVGHTHAVYVPPPTGGLFLDQGALDAITGGPFLIDHDQKLQAQAALIYDIGRTGFWAGTNVRYDSGLVTDADPAELLADPDNFFAAPYVVVHSGTDLDPNRIQPRTIIDFSLGADLKTHGVPLSIQADVLNATNKKGLYNIASVFGGTHVIPPRMLAVRLRYSY
ncbi:MAG: TonB-dependent receptor [Thermoanaerobaculia bacterium]